jgi:phosphate transport system permease protein
MTDAVLPRLGYSAVPSDVANVRLRARYRAERRFKRYGLLAIGLTALFLVVVLSDIVTRGLPAFVQHRLMMDITVDKEEIDPTGKGDPATIRAGDFQRLVRDALRAQFPDVKERTARRQLDGLLSSGASDVLREKVVANPALVSAAVKTPVLLSANADLYFKGGATRIQRRNGAGTATVDGMNGDVAIKLSTSDLAIELADIKKVLLERARGIQREADRVRLASGADRSPELVQRIAELEAEAAALRSRAEKTTDAEALDDKSASLLVAVNGGLVKLTQIAQDQAQGTVLLPLRTTDSAASGGWQLVTYTTPESNRRLNDREVAWLEELRGRGLVERGFNWSFFTAGDSREPELAGIRGALVGSALTLLVTLLLCLPIGVAAAIYLEEFAPKNRLTEVIEVNINNLAAVPSIVFGLLGLAVFLNFFNLPRSAPLVGGLVLALLVLPTIIIASRAALKAVPPSIKEAALGVGASHQQAVFHHVLPLAMPGIMTGTIIGMAHALGETAPLLMIGMVAFIVEVPAGIADAATVLPVQIYLWSDLPEIAFQAKTAAAILVLLVFLFVMNGLAIVLRKRFERRW